MEMEFVPLLMVGMKRYWFVLKRIVVRYTNQYCFALIPILVWSTNSYCFAFIPILETVAYSPALYLLC